MANNLADIEMPSQSASIVDRIKWLIKLSRKSQADFSRLIGLDPANLSRVLTGKTPVGEGLILRIVANTGVSKDWLIDGSDVPFPRENTPKTPQGAPIYDIDVTAGSTKLERMFTDEHIIGRMVLPGLNPDNPIVHVSGNSMVPKLLPGCYISIQPVSLDVPIMWGNIYVVVLPDFRLVKYVRRNADPDLVTLHSANPDYEDVEVPRKDIEALYLVKHVINHASLT